MMRVIVLILAIFFSVGATGEVVVVSAKDSEIIELSQSKLKRLYLGKVDKIHGRQVNVYIIDNEKLHHQFIHDYMDIHPRQFARIWLKSVFTGKVKMLTKLSDTEELILKLKKDSRALGYIYKKDLTSDLQIVDVK